MTAALRPMTGADLPAVAVLEEELFGAEAWSPGMLASELTELPARYYLVAEDGGEVAGYAGLFAPEGGQADVLTLAVARPRWGEGIGARLLEALLAEAARRGCPEVFLEVRVDNERAQQLYLRRGFTRIGLRRGYYQPSGADAVVMRLDMRTPPAPGHAAARHVPGATQREPEGLRKGTGDVPAGASTARQGRAPTRRAVT